MNGVSAHIRHLWRARVRDARDGSGTLAEGTLASNAPNAARAYERMWIRATLGEACRRVEEALQTEPHDQTSRLGLDAWAVFRQHVLDGRTYRELLLTAGIAPTRADEEQLAVLTRRVVRRVRGELREIMRKDGVRESELDHEVARLTDGFDV